MVPPRPTPQHHLFRDVFQRRRIHARVQGAGCNVILVTKEKMLNEDWPREVLDEVFALPNDAPVELFLDLVAHIAKSTRPIGSSRWKSLTSSSRPWRANTSACRA